MFSARSYYPGGILGLQNPQSWKASLVLQSLLKKHWFTLAFNVPWLFHFQLSCFMVWTIAMHVRSCCNWRTTNFYNYVDDDDDESLNRMSGNIAWRGAVKRRAQLAVGCIQECRRRTAIVMARHLEHRAENRRGQWTEAGDGTWVPREDWEGAEWGLPGRPGEILTIFILCCLRDDWLNDWLIDWLSCGFPSHSIQSRSFWRRFPKPISWLGMEKKLNLTQQKHAFTNEKKCTTAQNKHKN